MVNDGPAHPPETDVGVTIYCTVPAFTPLGFPSVWLIVEPDPAVAPAIPPVMVPMVHEKLLAAVAVSAMLTSLLLQIVFVALLVITGTGLTVIVIVVVLVPGQEPETEVGVTIY
jgi:hypothetical protein